MSSAEFPTKGHALLLLIGLRSLYCKDSGSVPNAASEDCLSNLSREEQKGLLNFVQHSALTFVACNQTPTKNTR